MQQKTENFDQYLKQEWSRKYNEQMNQLFRSNLKFVHQRLLKDSPFYVYYNRQLVENKRESQIPQQVELVFDFDEDTFNFTKINEDEILFYADLEQEEVVPCSERNQKLLQEIEQEKEYNFEHPILLNAAPICKYHCILPPFINEQLPQVLGGELVQLVLNIFSMTSDSSSLRMGYNGIGGFSSINHLHFQLLYADELFPDLKMFPVERFPKHVLFSNGLKTKEDINLYSNGVTVSSAQGYPVRTIVIQPLNKPNSKAELAESFTSLSFVLQVVVERMLELKIPHNVMFSDMGTTIYVYPRQWDLLHTNEHKVKPAWVELGGLAIVRQKVEFDQMTSDEFDKILREECSVSEEVFAQIVEGVKDKLMSKFE